PTTSVATFGRARSAHTRCRTSPCAGACDVDPRLALRSLRPAAGHTGPGRVAPKPPMSAAPSIEDASACGEAGRGEGWHIPWHRRPVRSTIPPHEPHERPDLLRRDRRPPRSRRLPARDRRGPPGSPEAPRALRLRGLPLLPKGPRGALRAEPRLRGTPRRA